MGFIDGLCRFGFVFLLVLAALHFYSETHATKTAIATGTYHCTRYLIHKPVPNDLFDSGPRIRYECE